MCLVSWFECNSIGLTGTRQGMTDRQHEVVVDLVLRSSFKEAHHGDCIGADAEFHEILECCKDSSEFEIVIHPPTNSRQRAFCKCDRLLPEKSYTERDQDMVLASDVVLAISLHHWEMDRSGTWNTVRFARRKGRQILIIWPDGTTKMENQWRNYHRW